MPRSLPAGVRGGAPPPGTPGGHIGDRITYAYCTDCGKEWTWNANGIPPSMESCGHPDDGIVIINYRAESHGMLVDNTAPDSSCTPAENPERQLQAVRASSDAPEGAGGRGAGPVAESAEEREGRRPRFWPWGGMAVGSGRVGSGW